MDKKNWLRMRQAISDAGFEVIYSKGGHWKVYQDGHLKVTLPSTASDGRAYRNARSTVRRTLGVNV